VAHARQSAIIVKRSALFRYGVAGIAVAAAMALRLALEPVLGLYAPYLPFALAVIVASRFGGRGPGLAATAFSLVAVPYLFLEPRYTFRISEPFALPGLVLFAAVGTTISFLIGQVRESLISIALNEERLRLAQTTAQVGIWDRNPQTGEITFTPDLERAYGVDPGTIRTYEEWRGRVHPDDIGRIEAARDEALATHKRFEYEFRVIHSSGEVRWFSASGGAIYDEAGDIVRVFGVNMDITGRKRIEQALAEKSARLEELNTALELAHATVRTPDGIITSWNRGAATMYGWAPDEAIGRHIHDLLQTEFPEPLEKIQERLMERGNWEGELRHSRRDGSTVLVASHWSLQRDKQGRPSAVVEVNNDITAVRQAEQVIRESEAQFRTLANAIPQLCWMAGADGSISWYNQRWYEYTGTTPEQMEGWGWQSVHDPNVLPRVLERWKASVATGAPFDMVFPLRGADGVFRPFLTRVMPVRDSAGKVARWFGTNTDISEQIKTEQALRESEERLLLAQQVARVGTFEWNIQTGVNRWTPELEAMYGLPPGGFAGTQRAWEELIHPEDRSEFVRRIQRSMDTGAFEGEWRVIQPGGKVRWMFGRAWVFKDDSGRPLRLIGVSMDITERKQAEELLQQQTALVNLSHDAIISADENRVIRTWNTGAQEMYGWTEGEAVGNAMPQLLRTGPVSIADIDRKLARDGRWDGELVHTRRDGKQINVESRQILRRDAAGVPIGILEINRDVSDRKRLEDQFRQAQKLEGIGRLAGSVAHDFNNLLTVISGYTQSVLDDLEAQRPLRGPLEQVSKAAARAASLTRQLLVFSRRQVVEPRNIILNDLVRDFQTMLRRLIGEDIRLVLSLAPDAGVIRADAGQIEQVILNLAVNAKDAMPKGGTLSIETSRLLADERFAQAHLSVQPGLYVVLVVSDTGVGMSPEVKSHLFEPFFTTKETGKGTGLGLSTVYGIVKQSGGSIWVYSEPGQGTVFRILSGNRGRKRTGSARARKGLRRRRDDPAGRRRTRRPRVRAADT
jgi:PAS domain S-box-containing protein